MIIFPFFRTVLLGLCFVAMPGAIPVPEGKPCQPCELGNSDSKGNTMLDGYHSDSMANGLSSASSESTESEGSGSSEGYSFSGSFSNFLGGCDNITDSISSFITGCSSDLSDFFTSLTEGFIDGCAGESDGDSDGDSNNWEYGGCNVFSACDAVMSDWSFDFGLPSGCTSMDCLPSMNISGFTVPAGCTSLDCIGMRTEHCSDISFPEETGGTEPDDDTGAQECPATTAVSESTSATAAVVKTVYSTESSLSTTLVTVSCTTCEK